MGRYPAAVITQQIILTIPGHPAPKGSMKCVGARGKVKHQLVEDNTRTAPWRKTIADAATKVTQRADPRQPIDIELTFTIERPASHYGTGRNSRVVKPSAPAYPSTHGTGDIDKLARLAIDALQDAGILPDDAQAVDLTTRKRYPRDPATRDQTSYDDALPYPGVRIRINPI